jgi:hypothetical protein
MEARDAYLTLFRECFEGRAEGNDYTWFVEGLEGIFDALDSTSAEKASVKPTAECASIAAHAYHIRYTLRGGNAHIGGPPIEGDWESSWSKQSVTPEEWEQLKADVRYEYAFFLRWFEANEDWSDPVVRTGVMAQLPHFAYHLGAIRQLMKV